MSAPGGTDRSPCFGHDARFAHAQHAGAWRKELGIIDLRLGLVALTSRSRKAGAGRAIGECSWGEELINRLSKSIDKLA